MNRLRIFALLLATCIVVSVRASDSESGFDPQDGATSVVVFERFLEGISDGQQILRVVPFESAVRIELARSDGYSEITELNPDYRVEESSYLDESGKVFAKSHYDYDKGEVTYERNGAIGILSISGLVMECNSVLFVAIPRICKQEDGHIVEFDAIQTPLGRKVPMEIQFTGRESLDVGQKEVDVLHFEMTLRGWKGRLFWPYKYHYWFSVEDGLLMKYEGVDGENRKESLQRIAQELNTSTP